MMLTWLADACRDTGYPVVEVAGWQTRGHGGMTAGHGVVGHWTAGPAESATSSNTPSLKVVTDGRPGLDGPLCNVYTAFDGTLYVVAAGKAYHAGVSEWQGETDLNGLYAGNEVESPGNFVFTAAQLDVTPRLHAAILRRMGRPAQFSCAHFECAEPPGRKQDGPARNMAGFRQLVAAYQANPSKIRMQEDDMPTLDEIGAEMTRRLATFKSQHLDGTLNRVKDMEESELPDIKQQLADLAAAVADLGVPAPPAPPSTGLVD